MTPPDSDGCLCVVASFVSAAQTIDEVTAEVAKRALMSPLLSDFIEFRFADLGPRPDQGDDRSAAVRRITSALLNSQAIAGRNHFALVVVDRSAALVAELLGDCAASPFLGELRMQSLGIANSDDRPGRALTGGSRPETRIETSPTGVWSRKEDLVSVLRGFVDELPAEFSARSEPGLSIEELGDLRERYHAHQAQQASGAGPADPGPAQVTGTQADGAGPVPDPKPDILSGTLHPAPARAPQAPGEPETAGQQAQAPDGTGHLPAPDAQQDPRPEPAGRASRSRRWIPDLIRRRGQQPQTGATEDDGADTAPATEGLAYLLVVGDESCRDEAALNRSRSALLEVDKKIGELPGFAYQVRMLHGDEDGLRGDLREAGQLGRRDIKRTVAGVDFAAALEGVRASLRRDRAPLKAAASTRPAVVFFTPEPPLADAAAADLLRDLAREALIVWALPRSSKGLLSAAFTDAPGVQVVMADHGVADEIATLLISGADTMKANA